MERRAVGAHKISGREWGQIQLDLWTWWSKFNVANPQLHTGFAPGKERAAAYCGQWGGSPNLSLICLQLFQPVNPDTPSPPISTCWNPLFPSKIESRTDPPALNSEEGEAKELFIRKDFSRDGMGDRGKGCFLVLRHVFCAIRSQNVSCGFSTRWAHEWILIFKKPFWVLAFYKVQYLPRGPCITAVKERCSNSLYSRVLGNRNPLSTFTLLPGSYFSKFKLLTSHTTHFLNSIYKSK